MPKNTIGTSEEYRTVAIGGRRIHDMRCPNLPAFRTVLRGYAVKISVECPKTHRIRFRNETKSRLNGSGKGFLPKFEPIGAPKAKKFSTVRSADDAIGIQEEYGRRVHEVGNGHVPFRLSIAVRSYDRSGHFSKMLQSDEKRAVAGVVRGSRADPIGNRSAKPYFSIRFPQCVQCAVVRPKNDGIGRFDDG